MMVASSVKDARISAETSRICDLNPPISVLPHSATLKAWSVLCESAAKSFTCLATLVSHCDLA
eukprot:9949492-Alexandrium_andersonii.AAC.1